MNWIESHGIAVLLICYVFAVVMASGPKPPPHWGFWKLWAYNAAQALGANAGKFAEQSPVIQKLQASETSVDSNGIKTPEAPKP